ncbi:hypothetical protein F4820DRAFT_437148 [Hypoxylon rubiginosum]|uniref:Uncharacterized protein n=1 Tax=Hypoxylon rubiginosum TaxID=110542 RepID=A0ACB9YM24_9PEZI|nr:hypothetical protein F4820DRAFT_437148 [Hypoxylon rubiginosum]
MNAIWKFLNEKKTKFKEGLNNFTAGSSDKFNDAKIDGDDNEIAQDGKDNKCNHRGDWNSTGQEGTGHRNDVNGNRNRTHQLVAHNVADTLGNNHKIAQKGNGNKSKTTGEGKTIVQYMEGDEYIDAEVEYIQGKELKGFDAWYTGLQNSWPWNRVFG